MLGDVAHGGSGRDLDGVRLDDRRRAVGFARLGRRCAAPAAAAAALGRRWMRRLTARSLGVDHDPAPASGLAARALPGPLTGGATSGSAVGPLARPAVRALARPGPALRRAVLTLRTLLALRTLLCLALRRLLR